jgi:hypothetical protein
MYSEYLHQHWKSLILDQNMKNGLFTPSRRTSNFFQQADKIELQITVEGFLINYIIKL